MNHQWRKNGRDIPAIFTSAVTHRADSEKCSVQSETSATDKLASDLTNWEQAF